MLGVLACLALLQDGTVEFQNDVTRLNAIGSTVIAAGRDNLYAIDSGSWKIRHKHGVDGMKGEHYIGVAGGLVIVTSSKGLGAYPPDLSGSLWTRKIKGVAMDALDATGGILVIYQDTGPVESARLHDKKGKVLATMNPGFAGSWVLHVNKEVILFGKKEPTEQGNLAAFSGNGGKLWAQSMPGFRPLGLTDEAFMFGKPEKDGTTTVRVLDPKTGGDLLKRSIPPGIGVSGPAGNKIFSWEATSYSGTKLTAIDISGGTELWTTRLPVSPRRILSTPAGLVVETSRNTMGFDPSNGAKRWEQFRHSILKLSRYRTEIFNPVVGGSIMLMAYDPSKGESMHLVDVASGEIQKKVPLSKGIRTGTVLGTTWLLSEDMQLKAYSLP